MPRPDGSRPSAASIARRASLVVLGIALLYASAHFVWLVTHYNRTFVHPDFYGHIVQETVLNGLGLHWSDALYAIQIRSPGESRPRFLAYAIEAVDQKIRLFLYRFVVVPPTFLPIAWILQLVVAPWCLFELMKTLTESRGAALAAVVVYVTSVGFLSGFSMSLLQGKALSHVALLLVLYLMSRLHARAREGELFSEIPSPLRYAVLAVLLGGLFLDEMPWFAFPLSVVMFPSLFLPASRPRRSGGAMIRNGLVFVLPVVVFLFIVLVVVPPVTQRYFGLRFDYLGNVFARGTQAMGAKSPFEGPHAVFGAATVWENFTTLFGVSLVPWQVSPIVKSPYGDYPGTQVMNAAKIAVFVIVFGLLGLTALRTGVGGRLLRRVIVVTVLFLVFLSLVSIRHIPVSTGYYYGSSFAAVFALLIGAWYASVEASGRAVASVIVAAMVLGIALVQTDNFAPINHGWMDTHHELVARPRYRGKLPLAPPRDVTAAELHDIWRAWRGRWLDAYLAERTISVGAVYLVVELQTIDRVRAATPPAASSARRRRGGR